MAHIRIRMKGEAGEIDFEYTSEHANLIPEGREHCTVEAMKLYEKINGECKVVHDKKKRDK